MTFLIWLWNGLPWYVQWGFMAGAGLMLVGLALNLGRIVKSVSGWWGVAGLGLALASIAAWAASKPDLRVDETRDSDRPVRAPRPTIFRRTAKRTPGKKRPTIFDR